MNVFKYDRDYDTGDSLYCEEIDATAQHRVFTPPATPIQRPQTMTSKIEVSRELLEKWAWNLSVFGAGDSETAKQIDALLEAPEAPRQSEPVAWLVQWNSTISGITGHREVVLTQPFFDPAAATVTPLSPDHPGGAGEVLPVVWRIPVNGEWFYGTKEQCEREYAEYTADFTAEDFDEDGPAKPEPLAHLDKVKELNQ